MNLHLNETITSPAGPLHITGTATLTINWGDGETQTGITTPGAPYPDGQLTHHYPNLSVPPLAGHVGYAAGLALG